jgi:hypothetical protein
MKVYNGDLYISGNAHNTDINIYKVPDYKNKFSRPKIVQKYSGSYTYPKFTVANGKLLFVIRSGMSGNGEVEIYDFLSKEDNKGWRLFSNV